MVYTNNKVILDSGVIIKAKAFKPGWISSDIIQQRFYHNSFTADSVTLLTSPDNRYKGAGAKSLTDLDKSDLNFSSGKWVGYMDSSMIVKLFYNTSVNVSSITLSTLKIINRSIFPPSRVDVWASMDNVHWAMLTTMSPDQPTKEAMDDENIAVTCRFKPTALRYLKLIAKPVAQLPAWHSNKGNKGWMFVDEVFVN